jgi:ketosteroid isomerase-like protein
MSQENVDLVAAFFDAYNTRDVEAVDRLLASGAKVTTLSSRAGLPARWEPGGTRRYFQQLDEAWADLRVEVEDFHELGDRVVAVGVMRGTGKTSNAEVVRSFATVFVVNNSRFVRVDSYSDPKEALEAAGLREEAMSQKNVELAARFYEPATSKDELLAAMPTAMALCHPDVEWTSREDGLTYRGREGATEAMETYLESFDDYRFEVQRIIDCGSDDVLVIGLEVATGAISGAEVRSLNYELLTIREGMIVRFRDFRDETEALEAAGLRE